MTTAKPLDILIIGGSLAGLLTGTALSRLGHRIRIFERAPAMANQGAGIVAQPDLLHFLSAYDRTHATVTVKSGLRQYLDGEGKVLEKEDTEQKMTSWDAVYWVLRANFDGRGSEYIEDSFEVKGKKVEVKYTSGEGKEATQHMTEADILIACDGASSTVRSSLLPDVKRKYAGYLAYRGLIPEKELSKEACEALIGKFSFFHAEGTQCLTYAIPGESGSTKEGERNLNWVWYVNLPEDIKNDSKEPGENPFISNEGFVGTWSLHSGQLQEKTIENVRERARKQLPPAMREAVLKTPQPFLQAVTDVRSPEIVHSNGRVILAGDATCGPRPHTAASTNQAALHALWLAELVGEAGKGWEDVKKALGGEYTKRVLEYSEELDAKGRKLGNRSQFGKHPWNVEGTHHPASPPSANFILNISHSIMTESIANGPSSAFGQRGKVVTVGNGARILCIADVRGNLSQINDLARESRADVVLHTGDFGFYDESSLERITDKTLRHVIQYSPLIPPSSRHQFPTNPSTPTNQLRQAITSSSTPILSELPLFLAGAKRFEVPVYTVWGACEDVRVIEKFRAGEYRIPNFHLVDEHSSWMIDLGGCKLRLLGLGGAVVTHKLFDNGEGRTTIAGGQGTMWTTILQMGELLDTAARVFDYSETRVFISHASPGREGLLAQLALTLKADFTVSAGLHFRYASSYNDFSVHPSHDHFRAKLISARAGFMDVWETVRGQVEASVSDTQRVLLDNVLEMVNRMPKSTDESAKEDASFKNMWNFNLSDAAFGWVVLGVEGGRVSAEMKAQGFNFAYRRGGNGQEAKPIQSPVKQQAAPVQQQQQQQQQQPKAEMAAPEPVATPTEPNPAIAASAGAPAAPPTRPARTPSQPFVTGEQGYWVSPVDSDQEAREIFATQDHSAITGIRFRPDKHFAYVYFGSKETMLEARARVVKSQNERTGRTYAISEIQNRRGAGAGGAAGSASESEGAAGVGAGNGRGGRGGRGGLRGMARGAMRGRGGFGGPGRFGGPAQVEGGEKPAGGEAKKDDATPAPAPAENAEKPAVAVAGWE
ncbi:hypothetical protein G7K_5593-t1 [Saitoella complicata NRRL Y-17804]|uniref:DUF2433 domain-containing protein n=1 Tax=Saitoella complicata (strain BCRC 22490 / CBS 7301 / JCM 7358 / NBRC 10748 / NRRL Y-17804) TaxID=698492 RepID=A0A0E9NNW6_SAICN|nr:hypothetical protein G7K_5593-t1 [Saitoella complicata NRRL Y-17804]